MKNLFFALLSLLISPIGAQAAFSDVSSSHPHAEAIAYVQAEGMVSGYPDGTFKPDATINRVELLKILIEAEHAGSPECRRAYNYTDVDWSGWYGNYLQVASCLGIVGGYPDGTFKPANPVLITEATKIISGGFTHEVNAETPSAWYTPFVNNLANRKAIPTTIDSVGSQLTRGQMAEMIYRLKTNNTSESSHTLASLEGTASVSAAADASLIQTEVDTATEAEIDAELDSLFEDLFGEEELDLDSLIDF